MFLTMNDTQTMIDMNGRKRRLMDTTPFATWASVLCLLPGASVIADVHAAFDDIGSDTPYEIAYDGPGAAGIFRGGMMLTEGERGERGSMLFATTNTVLCGRMQATWRMRLGAQGHGLGLALLDTEKFGDALHAPAVEQWEEPNIPAGFGIGFDTHNPPGGSPFDARGNIYDRPQREVSLHFNGVEVANARAPAEFATGAWISVAVEIVFIPGGANVTVRFGDRYVYDDHFVAHLLPFTPRIAFGARSDDDASSPVEVDDIAVRFLQPLDAPPADPTRITAFEHELITPHQQRAPGIADFSPIAPAFRGRVIATLQLAAPSGGIDSSDRGGSFSIFDDNHERFEAFRFVTPFGRGGTWHVDVTHLLPLFRGKRQVELRIDTWEKGWDASVELAFYPGEMALIPFEIINLWQGEPEIGNGAEPVEAFYAQRRITIDPRMDAAFLHTTVTGHGMHPNTGNAAEFMPIDRTITIRDRSFTNTLWVTDNDLNPVRPQGGTWKYDRAGWGPGRIASPWIVEVSRFLERGREATVDYDLAPYQNLNRDDASPPIHWTECQLVLYELPESQPPVYSCPRIESPVVVDGRLDEDIWRNATWLALATDIRGRERHLPREYAVAALYWDDDHLYVAARIAEPHISAELTERDDIVYFDNDIELFLDPGHDGLNYFEIEVNAMNTVFDLLIHRPYLDAGDGDIRWNWSGMKSAVSTYGTLNDPTDVDVEWDVELALPWAALREHAGDVDLPPRRGQRWGMNFSRVQWTYDIVDGRYVRNESRPEDNWVWAPIGSVNMHHPGHWGVLVFD